MAKIEVTEETITPEKAQRYLNSMVSNRTLTDQRVVDYALVMDDGGWIINGETLKFNDEGQLIDGQHRLQACILAGKSFKTLVARGVSDPQAFATIDVGKTRTAGDVFSIAGIVDSNHMSGAANIIFLYKKRQLTTAGPKGLSQGHKLRNMVRGTPYVNASYSRMPTKDELLAFVQDELGVERLHTSVKLTRNSGAVRLLPMAQLSACHYLFAEKNREEADRFMNELGQGVGLQVGDPVLTLRERLITSKTGTTRLTRWAALLMVIKAWNKRREGGALKQLKVLDGEEYPRIK